MLDFECKQCGESLPDAGEKCVAVCEKCGCINSLPICANELVTAFNRASLLLRLGKYEKSAEVYTSIVNDNPELAEGWWGLVLCDYGVEYLPDGDADNNVSCRRAGSVLIEENQNYLKALQHAGRDVKTLYKLEASKIAAFQQGMNVEGGKKKSGGRGGQSSGSRSTGSRSAGGGSSGSRSSSGGSSSGRSSSGGSSSSRSSSSNSSGGHHSDGKHSRRHGHQRHVNIYEDRFGEIDTKKVPVSDDDVRNHIHKSPDSYGGSRTMLNQGRRWYKQNKKLVLAAICVIAPFVLALIGILLFKLLLG